MIKEDFNELTRITNEIKRLSISLRSLRRTKKIVEDRMTKFLKERDFPGGKVGDSVILLQEKTVSKSKTKKDLATDMASFFMKHNITNPEKFMKELNDTSKDSVIKNVIKINPRKDK